MVYVHMRENNMVQTKEERKATRKKYSQSSRGKEKVKEWKSKPENQAKLKEWKAKPENQVKDKARRQTPAYKANKINYQQSDKGKLKIKEYQIKNQERTKNERDDNRLKILQYYSKRLSKSDIPCCICCGVHSHIDFLAIDHVLGKKQMDSIPELIAIGYSSTMRSIVLNKWIIDNNFPKGFQILCHNCNHAKGMSQNKNVCPMKNKPHF